jgi:hypothetical protein
MLFWVVFCFKLVCFFVLELELFAGCVRKILEMLKYFWKWPATYFFFSTIYAKNRYSIFKERIALMIHDKSAILS